MECDHTIINGIIKVNKLINSIFNIKHLFGNRSIVLWFKKTFPGMKKARLGRFSIGDNMLILCSM